MTATHDPQSLYAPALALATGSALIYERTLFVLSKGGHILCLSPDQSDAMKKLMAESWQHTATIDPALWIKSLIEAEPDHASDMMDELNFGPNVAMSHADRSE